MISVPGGAFRMGSEDFYPEEGPITHRTVASFELDRAPVTNAQFADFVGDTGYVTVAEIAPDPHFFPDADPTLLVPGSLVFRRTEGPVDLRDWRQWWEWTPGAQWRHPHGRKSDLIDKAEHPVVQVAFHDANAYAHWAGKRLPTEDEWEFAARGGLDGATFAWGNSTPDRLMANIWQGDFPWRNVGAAGWFGTSPVGSFDPNGYGLVDMIGNTWEWTSQAWTPRHSPSSIYPVKEGCTCGPALDGPRRSRVLKGGSHLCAPEYCLRYRPAARSQQDEDSATTHIGFRCARSL